MIDECEANSMKRFKQFKLERNVTETGGNDRVGEFL